MKGRKERYPNSNKTLLDSGRVEDAWNELMTYPFEKGLGKFITSRSFAKHSKLFWNSWLPKVVDNRFFGERELLLLMRKYLRGEVVSNQLIRRLLDLHPLTLIKGLRVFEGFRSDHHFESLQLLAKSNDVFVQDNYLAMHTLRVQERLLFSVTTDIQKDLLDANPMLIAVCAACWLEYRIEQSPVDDNGERIVTIGIFLESIFSGMNLSLINCDLEKIRTVVLSLQEDHTNKTFNATFAALDSWFAWYSWKSRFWDTYCWDLNYLPVRRDDSIEFAPISVKERFAWTKKGEFYSLLKDSYRHKGKSRFAEQIKSGDTFEFTEFNSMVVYAEDLHLDCYGGVNIEKIIRAIEWTRYESDRWANKFKQRLIEESEIAGWILHMGRKQDLLPISCFCSDSVQLKGVEQDENQVVLDAISSHIGSTFNRFKPKVNTHSFPLIKLGESYLMINGVAARHEGVFSLPEATLSGKGSKADDAGLEVCKMEEAIARKLAELNNEESLFGKAFWSDSGNGRGDVDVAWRYENTLYVFQLKRSMLRTTLEDMFYERFESLEKAVNQISKAMKTIENEPKTIPYFTKHNQKLTVIPLVLHTSFECSNEVYKGITVLNYFELLEEIEHAKTAADINGWIQSRLIDPFPIGYPEGTAEEKYRESVTFRLPVLN